MRFNLPPGNQLLVEWYAENVYMRVAIVVEKLHVSELVWWLHQTLVPLVYISNGI